MTYIAHITTVHPRGDTRINVKEMHTLVRNLDARLALFVQDAPAGEAEDCSGFEIISSGPKVSRQRYRIFVGVFRMMKLVLREKPDIIHFHDPELIPMCLLLRILGYKVIYDVHEDFRKQIVAAKKSRIFRALIPPIIIALEWAAGRAFNGIISATSKIGSNFPPSRTILVQNFPMLEELLGETRANIVSKSENFLYVGGISKIRGIQQMIDALEHVQNPSVRLLLAGNFIPSALKDEIAKRKGWERTEFVGWADRNQLVNLLKDSRAGLVLLHPTENYIDALPVKMFEYMAAGIPVIASDFPLWRSIIEEANCGKLVDPLDVSAITGVMDWMIANPDAASEMGQNGRRAVREKYNWENESAKLIDFYSEKLGVPLKTDRYEAGSN